MPNRLHNQVSPYLLQHADNPVDWYAWEDAAFEKARQEDKPILLSIGYSTCHWCHVMAHECFEDEAVAQVLNAHFVCIKVDKEERPDVDSLYMAASQAFTGSGGWPNNVFIDADGRPFFAGTYFAKPDFLALLKNIHDLWLTDRQMLMAPADKVLARIAPQESDPIPADRTPADLAVAVYSRLYDSEYGGFGRAPKFPLAHDLLFLLHYYERYHHSACLQMAEKTLTQMYRGGLFDHIGGGFCRYSTDRQFLVPHFEKMLYDNALLILAYARAYAITQKPRYRRVAEQTADWVIREMTAPQGGFYSALDADSGGEEGRFYLFDKQEILDVLGERGEAFCRRFGIVSRGNFEGKNIPNRLGSDPDDTEFDDCLPLLAAYRRKRHALHRDDKILTYWNGLMIAAMCGLYRVTADETYLAVARDAERFVREKLSEGERLFASYRQGRRGVGGFLEDYAGFLFAQLALYDVTLELDYLTRARRLCEYVLDQFADTHGFFLTGQDGERLAVRQKETYDGALPSGNSLMAYNLVRLRQLTRDYEQAARQQLEFLAAQAKDYPSGHAVFLLALLEDGDPPPSVTVVSVAPVDPAELARRLPAGTRCRFRTPDKQYPLKGEKTTYYICRNGRCLPPSNDLSGIS